LSPICRGVGESEGGVSPGVEASLGKTFRMDGRTKLLKGGKGGGGGVAGDEEGVGVLVQILQVSSVIALVSRGCTVFGVKCIS
jgi:hypothetical protein